MTGTETKLSYSLSGYDYADVCRTLTRRLLPAYYSYAFVILLVIIFILTFALSLAFRHGYPLLGKYNWLFFAALLPGWLALFRRRQKLAWDAVANAPNRRGTTNVTVDDEGVTFSAEGGRTTLFWSGIVDVIEGKDGLLVLPGDMEFFPIPAKAFTNAAEKEAVLADLKTRLARAKGTAA